MKQNISKKQLREFGLLIGFVFPVLIGWLIPILFGHGFRTWSLWIGIPGIVLGLTFPLLLYYPYRLWMTIGHLLGWVNSRLILGLVFMLVLVPIAFFMKFFGYDPLRLKKQKVKSYFEDKINHMIELRKIF